MSAARADRCHICSLPSHLLVRDLMLEAVPYSSLSILLTRAIWSLGGMMSEIMLVPLLRHDMNKGTHQMQGASMRPCPEPKIKRTREQLSKT